MKRRAWIALAMAPLWLFALRFAWLWAGLAAEHLWDRVTAPAEVAEATSEPSLSGTDAAVPDWARAPIDAASAPAWLKQSAVPSWAPKPQVKEDLSAYGTPAPVVGQPRKRDMERHRPQGTPVDYDPFKGTGDQHGSVAETLRAAEASRSKRTADQPPSGASSP